MALDTTTNRNSSARPMSITSKSATTVPTLVGTAHTSRDSRSDLPSQNPNAWKRASSPIADAYADLVGRGGNIDEVLASRKAGDRSSMSSVGAYNNASKHRTQYYEDQFRYKDSDMGMHRETVHSQSPVVAELKTNVIIKDEFTLVTDLSYHLAQRYTRPDSSIMIKVDHSACLALGGTFDPCYILNLTTVPSQMGPSTNKRNAALIQSFMADILSVPADRGIIKFQPIEECNYAMNGNTMLGEIERLEKAQGADSGTGAALKRAVTNAGRKSIPSFNKKSAPKLDADVKAPNGTPPTTNGTTTPVERRRRSHSATPPPASAITGVFELPAMETERPVTAGGVYAAENGLRMNGVSKEDLLGAASRTPNGRPKTFAGEMPQSVQDQIRNEPMPKMQRQHSASSSHHRHSHHATRHTPKPTDPAKKANIPISPKPPSTATHARRKSTEISKPAPPKKDTYLDGVTTTPKPVVEEKVDPKIDARAAEKNRQIDSKDTAANTAKRRSTVTATPKMPVPPPIPESRSKEPKMGKRKSFLSAFRRN